MDDLLASVSHVVSRAARHVGFALSADSHAAVLQRIEFVPLGGSRVLVVVVARGNQVTQKVVDAGETVRPDDLAQAAQLPEHRVRRPAAARGARGGAWRGCSRSGRSTTSCWRARCGWRSRRWKSCRNEQTIPRRRRGVAARRQRPHERRVDGHAARAARDDGRERADGAAAQRVHRRSRTDGGDRRRAHLARSAAIQPDRVHRGRRQRRRARSASSARRACTTRARSRWWTARRRPSRASSATPISTIAEARASAHESR